jgi:hypothetical protein
MKLTGRMEQWIETRLWNRKVENAPIAIRQIVAELANLFGIDLTPGTKRQMAVEIDRIRSRVYKRHKRWLARRAEWAKNLGVPERLIERWFRAGWIDPGKPAHIKALTGILFERDYYFRFIEKKDADDRIPGNPDISITAI